MQSSSAATQKNILGSKSFQWEGAKPFPCLVIFLLGAALWFFPAPEGLDPRAWHLFAVFVATIVAIIWRPLPTGAVSLIALSVCVGTQTLTIQQGLSSFSSTVVWLIVLAFAIARGFSNTGLGKRVAYFFVRAFGCSTLGLSYAIVLSELILCPLIPSNTARGAGVLFPIIESLAIEQGSRPKDGTRRKMGAFLMKVAFQGNLVCSALFLTAIATNPLILSLAESLGVQITWTSWAVAAFVPGLINLLLLPWMLYWIYPPEVSQTPSAKQIAEERLRELGPLRFEEKTMMGIFFGLITLWVMGPQIGLHSTSAALIGFSVLMLSGVLKWKDVLAEKSAWETLIWFSILLMMAHFLTEFGMMKWFSDHIHSFVAGYSWGIILITLSLIYFYSHYFFTSSTAHASALYSSFLLIMLSSGVPPLLGAMTLGVLTSLSAGITHYGTGPAPVYFGAGYVPVREWWQVGALLSVMNLAIWFVVGGAWWKIIGLW